MPKYIFVTGGAVSSIGKGIAIASIGTILKSRQISVAVQKPDPYLNVDPGTMSPYQYGEAFVTKDGGTSSAGRSRSCPTWSKDYANSRVRIIIPEY